MQITIIFRIRIAVLVASCRLIHCTETWNDFHRYVSVIRTRHGNGNGNGYGTLKIRHKALLLEEAKKAVIVHQLSTNSTWLVTSRLDTTRHDTFDVSSASRRLCRASRGRRVEPCCSSSSTRRTCHVETWRDEPSGIRALAGYRSVRVRNFCTAPGWTWTSFNVALSQP